MIKMAEKIMGISHHPKIIFEQPTIGQAKKIVTDTSHLLYHEYKLMLSGRRYKVHKWKYNRYRYSFVPLSVTFLHGFHEECRRGTRF